MLRLSSQNKYSSTKVLRNLPAREFSTLRKKDHPQPTLDNRQEQLQKENHQLKVRCNKIDQIEKYVHILVQQNGQLKKNGADLQKKNSELSREMDHMKRQKFYSQQTQGGRGKGAWPDGQSKSLRVSQFEDTFQSIKWQQELTSQRQKHERVLKANQSKHRLELQQLDQELKGTQNRLEQENTIQRREIESLISQNTLLRRSNHEQQQALSKLRQEGQKTALQLKKYVSLSQTVKNQADKKANIITDSHKAIQVMTKQLQILKAELQQSRNQKAMFQRISGQLKQEGAAMLTQGNQLKQTVLQLQELRYSHMRQIQKLQSQFRLINQKNVFIAGQLQDSQTRHKQLIAALQRDNIELKVSSQTIQTDLHTKQKEIHDLIKMVQSLEISQRSASISAVHLKESNIKLSHMLREIEGKYQADRIQLQELRIRCQEKQKYAAQTERNYVELKSKLLEMEMIYEKENLRVKEFDKLLEQQLLKRRELETQRQQLIQKSQQRQKLLGESHQCINECQKVYLIEKQNHATSKRIINELQEVIQTQQKQFQMEREQFVGEGLQKLQVIITEKYQNILKEKTQHFKTKIRYLESQISLLQTPQLDLFEK